MSNSTEAVKFYHSTKLVSFIVLMFVTQWDESLEDSSHVSLSDSRTSHALLGDNTS